METNTLQKYHDLFILSILLILKLIINNINDNSIVKKNAETFYQAFDNKQFEMSKISDMIKKVFTVISNNINLFKTLDSNLFSIKEIKEEKEIKITIIPGIDLEEVYTKFNADNKKMLWKYIRILYYASIKMIYTANNSMDKEILKICKSIQKNITEDELYNEFYKIVPDSKLYKKENSFNPYIGISSGQNTDYGIDEITSGCNSQSLEQQNMGTGMSSIVSLLGIDKMFNLDQLSEQLKNIDPNEIDAASENIKKLLGGNLDENTSEMINMMLHDITDELRKDNLTQNGNSINSIFKVADIVANKMIHKIDPKKIDMNKVWQSTQNLANNYTDQQGNKIFKDNNNPLSMLSGLMEKQMKQMNNNNNNNNNNNKEILKDYNNILNKMSNNNGNNMGCLQDMMKSMMNNYNNNTNINNDIINNNLPKKNKKRKNKK